MLSGVCPPLIPQRVGGVARGRLGPHLHLTVLARARVPPGHDAAPGTDPRRARPDDIRIGRVGGGETGFAPADRVPEAARDPHPEQASHAAVARAARGRAVLAVAHDVVRNRVVGSHVIHLRDRKLNAVPGLAAVARNGQSPVTAHDLAITVVRVDPHVVMIPHRSPSVSPPSEGTPSPVSMRA